MIDLTLGRGVATITLNNPEKLNALNLDAIDELSEAFTAAEEGGVRALILRGEGRGFCAGRDISQVQPATDDVNAYLGRFDELMRQIAQFPAPTFAAAHGACLGVGLGLLIATDVVYIAENAKVGSPFANLGAILDSGGHALFFERLGSHRALDLIYTAELMSGTEAVAQGLFSRSVPADEVQAFTAERAFRVASGPTQALLRSKQIIAQLRDEPLWETVAAETQAQAALLATADYREGFAAFQGKRPPQFAGK